MANQNRKPQKRGKKVSPFYAKDDHLEKKKKFGAKQKKWQIEDDEIKQLQEYYNEFDSSKVTTFDDLPLSSKTKKGLKDAKYAAPTEIQKESIGLALQGHDILGAAKTGSGKTLAFLVPVLECLYRVKWNPMDGLGALIISPTRELAYQIFEVLKKIGKYHDFSAGLVIGGKHLKEEAERISRTNIVICTPGRMLQHMDETPYFSADNLHMLVLDEADRCLDLGFQQTMNAIIANLPPKRQTLLFSATQTKSVKDLARLSLKEPMYVSVHENAKYSTPQQLEQSYIVCELHQKLDFLWSFLKNHLKQKILVFISSCKQVRFIYEVYKKMRPGITVLCLHGAMKQLQRVAVYDSFCRKEHAVLFATDIAARGLDFPSINWVVQLDCPEDANTYIHRVGRTARYSQDGEALLVLLPSEQEGMIEQLQEKRIPIQQIKVNPRKLWSIQSKLQSMLAAEVQLKEFAQRAFVNYIKSVYLMSNKKIFDVQKLDTDQYARSLGLAMPPRIRFLQKAQKRREDSLQKSNKFQEQQPTCDNKTAELLERLGVKVAKSDSPVGTSGHDDENSSTNDSDQESDTEKSYSSNSEESDEDSESSNEGTKGKAVKFKSSPNESESFNFGLGEENIDDILTVKKVGVTLSDGEGEENSGDDNTTEILSNKARKRNLESIEKRQQKLAKKLLRKNLQINTKVTFDEDMEEEVEQKAGPMDIRNEDSEVGGLDLVMARKRMQEADKHDKELYRQKIRERHREKKLKEKERRRKQHKENEEDEPVAVLGSNEENASDDDHLPDPDQIYGPEKDGNENSDESQSDDQSEEESDSDNDTERPARKKMRTVAPHSRETSTSEESSDGSSSEDSSEDDEDEENEGNKNITRKSLETDEAIALKLLGL